MELDEIRTLHLFAGAGGGILADILLGHRPVCAVELEDYPRNILQQRQEDGCLPRFPVWDDIRTFDGKPWRGLADVVCGGFPCQDISSAGKGAGLAGDRSGLWFEMLRVVDEVKPRFVFAENSPNLRTRGLGIVVEGLNGLGYDVRWCVLGAWHVGANHKRNRMWLLAHSKSDERAPRTECPRGALASRGSGPADANSNILNDDGRGSGAVQVCRERPETPLVRHSKCEWWTSEPDVDRVANGVASGVDQIKALGNGQVPLVAATAWRILTDNLV